MRKTGRQYSAKRNYVVKVPGTGRVWWGILLSAAFVLVALLLLTGEKSLFKVIALYREQTQLSRQIVQLESQNEKLAEQIKNLKQGPEAFERIAREELGMVRNDEIVYRFVPPDLYQKQATE